MANQSTADKKDKTGGDVTKAEEITPEIQLTIWNELTANATGPGHLTEKD